MFLKTIVFIFLTVQYTVNGFIPQPPLSSPSPSFNGNYQAQSHGSASLEANVNLPNPSTHLQNKLATGKQFVDHLASNIKNGANQAFNGNYGGRGEYSVNVQPPPNYIGAGNSYPNAQNQAGEKLDANFGANFGAQGYSNIGGSNQNEYPQVNNLNQQSANEPCDVKKSGCVPHMYDSNGYYSQEYLQNPMGQFAVGPPPAPESFKANGLINGNNQFSFGAQSNSGLAGNAGTNLPPQYPPQYSQSGNNAYAGYPDAGSLQYQSSQNQQQFLSQNQQQFLSQNQPQFSSQYQSPPSSQYPPPSGPQSFPSNNQPLPPQYPSVLPSNNQPLPPQYLPTLPAQNQPLPPQYPSVLPSNNQPPHFPSTLPAQNPPLPPQYPSVLPSNNQPLPPQYPPTLPAQNQPLPPQYPSVLPSNNQPLPPHFPSTLPAQNPPLPSQYPPPSSNQYLPQTPFPSPPQSQYQPQYQPPSSAEIENSQFLYGAHSNNGGGGAAAGNVGTHPSAQFSYTQSGNAGYSGAGSLQYTPPQQPNYNQPPNNVEGQNSIGFVAPPSGISLNKQAHFGLGPASFDSRFSLQKN